MTNEQANQEMVELVERVARAMNPMAFDDAAFAEPGGFGQRFAQDTTRDAARRAIEACGIETLLKQQEEMREALTYIAETTDDERTSRRAFDVLASLTKPALEDGHNG